MLLVVPGHDKAYNPTSHGWLHYSDNAKFRDVFKGLVMGITCGKDYSGGGTTWHGRDFSLKVWDAYNNFYLKGLIL